MITICVPGSVLGSGVVKQGPSLWNYILVELNSKQEDRYIISSQVVMGANEEKSSTAKEQSVC